MIDEKGKLFGKVNLLDLLLILILIVAIGAASFIFLNRGTGSKTVSVDFTFEIKNKEAKYFDNLIVGESVTDGATGAYIGEIIAFEKKAARVMVQADDELKFAEPEGRYDGYVTVRSQASVEYPDLTVENLKIKIGRSVAFRSETLAMHGYIIDVNCDREKIKGAQ